MPTFQFLNLAAPSTQEIEQRHWSENLDYPRYARYQKYSLLAWVRYVGWMGCPEIWQGSERKRKKISRSRNAFSGIDIVSAQ